MKKFTLILLLFLNSLLIPLLNRDVDIIDMPLHESFSSFV